MYYLLRVCRRNLGGSIEPLERNLGGSIEPLEPPWLQACVRMVEKFLNQELSERVKGRAVEMNGPSAFILWFPHLVSGGEAPENSPSTFILRLP